MRVALLNPCFFPEVRRGSERMIRELANALIAEGVEPRLITAHAGVPARATEDGLPIVRNWRPPEGMLHGRGFLPYLTHLPFSYASLSRGDDDLAHAFYPTDAVAAARWGAKRGRPTVFSYMGMPTREVLASKRLATRMVVDAVESSSAVVALSRAAAHGLSRWLGVDARVIYPCVDLDAFPLAGAVDGPPTIFCPAATDDRRKRVDLLVEAFGVVRAARPDAVLLVMRPRDPSLAEALGREPGVELVDPVDSPAQLAPVYARAWVTALASYSEAFGIVMIESLATGRPIVGRDDGGIPEIVDGDERIGRLFSGDGVEDVARALLEALDLAADPGTVERCRARADDFSSASFGARHTELYRELLGSGSPSAARGRAGTPAISHASG